MSTTKNAYHIASVHNYYLSAMRTLEDFEKIKLILARLPDELDSTTTTNPAGGSLWMNVYSREELTKCMTLAQQWSKHTTENHIAYYTTIDGISVRLNAFEAALPPTCQLVEETVVIPASTITRKVVRCSHKAPDKPIEATAEEVVKQADASSTDTPTDLKPF